jgi:DNA-binding XRE family transcriptional regulator
MCLIELLVARRREGVTQAELGKAVGVSENTICKLETKRRTPDRALAEKIAKRLNAKPEDLFPNVK